MDNPIMMTEDYSMQAKSDIILELSKNTEKIILQKNIPLDYYNYPILDVIQRGFAVTNRKNHNYFVGTTGLATCTSLVLFDIISKTIALTHVDAAPFYSQKELDEFPEDYDLFKLESGIKKNDINIAPLNYNFNKIITSMISSGMDKTNHNMVAYLIGGKTDRPEKVIVNTINILKTNNIPLKGINILGNQCGRSFFVDYDCNFFNITPGAKLTYLNYEAENPFMFFLYDCTYKIQHTGGNKINYYDKYLKYKSKYKKLG